MKNKVHLTNAQWAYFEEQLIYRGYIKPNGEPIKCPCGSTHLRQVMIDVDTLGYIYEYIIVCDNCGENIAHWERGSYSPTYEGYFDIMAEMVGPLTHIRWTWEGVVRHTLNSAHEKIGFGAKKALKKG